MAARTRPQTRNGKTVTIAGKRVPARHATSTEAGTALRNVLAKHARAIANLKDR